MENNKIDLKNIKDPRFLKQLTYEELNSLCEDIREEIISVVSKNGGHLSSNLGVVEATVALCKTFDFSKDKIIFDVSHQCYAYKILTGRNLNTLRKKDGISGFSKRNESIYDHYETGHSSTSISACLGLAVARDLNKEKYDVIAFIGDGSLANGLSFEALNNLKNVHHKIIIIVNINDMAISPSCGAMREKFDSISSSDNTQIFDFFGFDVSNIIDGHNIKELEEAFIKAKNNDKTSIILIRTIKGKGYPYAENDKVGLWHGVSPFNIKNGEMTLEVKKSWGYRYQTILKAEMESNPKIISIVPGTSWGSYLTPIKNQFPTRFFDVGIAEEHALTFASGLAIGEYHPVVIIYSTFLQRGYDQLLHDLARMNCSVTLLIDRCGLIGEDGETHQGIYDEQFLLGVPNVVLAMANNISCAKGLFKESLKYQGVFAIRYPKANIDDISDELFECPIGKWRYETNYKSDITLISFGPCINNLKIICEQKKITLVNAIYQKPIDMNLLKEICSSKKIVIYDPYAIKEGFATVCVFALNKLNYKNHIEVVAIEDTFVPHMSIKQQEELMHVTIEDVIKKL